MGRFERDDTEKRRLPLPLGSATEDLRSTVEAEVSKIVERAEARAAEIEDRALEKASRIEQQSERHAQGVFEESRERLAQMLGELDAIEHSVTEAARSVRAEAERLASEIDRARTEPLEERATETAANLDSAPPAAPASTAAAPEMREMVRQQLLSLAEDGRTRADAERMLLRLEQGDQYLDLLDETYPEETARRRGLLRRRR